MNTDRLAGFAFAIFSLGIAFEAGKLPLGTMTSPGPGFYPLLLASLLLPLSIALVVSTFYRFPQSDEAVGPETDGRHVWPLVATVSALVMFVILLPLAGLAAAASILLAILLRTGGMNWIRVAVVSLAIAVGTELACRAMKIPLPEPWIGQAFRAGA